MKSLEEEEAFAVKAKRLVTLTLAIADLATLILSAKLIKQSTTDQEVHADIDQALNSVFNQIGKR